MLVEFMSKTGILFNNQMDDFATDPHKPNVYGMIPTESNHISPGRRPLSSMSPLVIVNSTTGHPR